MTIYSTGGSRGGSRGTGELPFQPGCRGSWLGSDEPPFLGYLFSLLANDPILPMY